MMELNTAAALYFHMGFTFFIHWLSITESLLVKENSLKLLNIEPINPLDVYLIYLDHLLLVTSPLPPPTPKNTKLHYIH